VLSRLGGLMGESHFWTICAVSLVRILLGLVLAVVLGVLLAVPAAKWPLIDTLLSPMMTAIRSTPVASFIILLILWVGRDMLPAVIVILMVMPVIFTAVLTGIRETDPLLLRTARAFHFSAGRTLRRVYVPEVLPHFLSALRSGLGLGWKAGIAAEVLTVPVLSIGRQLSEAKTYMEVTDLFAWTVVIVIMSLLIEKLLMGALQKLSQRKRKEIAHDNAQ